MYEEIKNNKIVTTVSSQSTYELVCIIYIYTMLYNIS